MEPAAPRFWMLAARGDWRIDRGAGIAWDAARKVLRLESLRPDPGAAEPEAVAEARLLRAATTLDAFGTWATADASGALAAGGAGGELLPLRSLPDSRPLTDLAWGRDGVLYAARADGVWARDLRDRWDDARLSRSDFTAWRLCAASTAGVWAMERTPSGPVRIAHVLARVTPRLRADDPPTEGFAPDPTEPSSEAIQVLRVVALSTRERAVAFAARRDDTLAVLTWHPDGPRVWLVAPSGATTVTTLEQVTRPYAVGWRDDDHIAVLAVGVGEVLVYPVPSADGTSAPLGDLHPLRSYDEGPFVRGGAALHVVGRDGRPRPVLSLPLPAYQTEARCAGERLVDGGAWRSTWHRMYLEASIPPGCGVEVLLAASDTLEAFERDEVRWYPHRFGAGGADDEAPRGAWVPLSSEVAYAPPMLSCPAREGVSGLFTALVQREGLRTRSLRGRYLRVRLILRGDGRATPEVAALRVYGPRASWVERWLPKVYHERLFGEDADAAGAATGADFLERSVGNVEGVLSEIDARVASAWLLTDARTTPEASLPWLASWVGLTLDTALPTAARRALLASFAVLRAWHGTARGVAAAIDAVTGGATRDGRVVIVEDYRLRRTFATLLGVDLGAVVDEMPGVAVPDGNSVLGDALILGDSFDERLKELFALRPDDKDFHDERAWFDLLAHRCTVLVHESLDAATRGLIERAVALEAPAHVAVAVTVTNGAFMTAVAALVGVDTWVAPARPAKAMTIDSSRLDEGDALRRAPSLDPRFDGG